jgi:putative membrane protein
MLSEGQDDVSNIHRRWSFTRIAPGSLKASYAMALACAAAIVTVSDLAHLGADVATFALRLPLGIAAATGLTLLDFVLLRGSPVNKLSKVVHVTSFSLLLWALTVLVGILADALFGKAGGPAYVVAGMLLAAGLRVGIFTSVFGASMARAVAICLVQPLIFFFAFAPSPVAGGLADPVGLGFGALFVALAIAWTALADRAGRPQVKSTFRLLQAFLSAWTENKTGGMEEYFESKASAGPVGTRVLKLAPAAGREISIVLPDVHPGPFGAVGGSNLPYVLYEKFGKSALVMHSVSDHSLNIPSGKEVARYIEGLQGLSTSDAGGTCSEPVQRRRGGATATAIAFGKSALVLLSLAPKGMEDVPPDIRGELEAHARALGFASLLVVDCHNAMGKQIDSADRSDLLSAASQCLDDLKGLPQGEFSAGFAGLGDFAHSPGDSPELGQAGLAVMVLVVRGKKYAIGWADSNNMENSLRDRIIARVNFDGDAAMLEVCTSDTHSTSGQRTRQGYFALGSTGNPEQIVGAYAEMCKAAAQDARGCQFSLLSATSEVKVMGAQFGDYSAALDRSLNLTKVFVGITFAAFVALQVLA